MALNDSGAFGSAMNFCLLIRELKRRGHERAPAFADALQVARDMQNKKLSDWVSEQKQPEQFENLLRLHWNTSA
jgi:hypothetical protein